MATRINGQPTRRINPSDPDKIAADSYVKEVEELRKVLKDIKMKYRKAEAIAKGERDKEKLVKAIDDMEAAVREKSDIVFPPFPKREGQTDTIMSIHIIKEISISNRRKIISTAMLWKKDLSQRRHDNEAVEARQLNASKQPSNFRTQMTRFGIGIQREYGNQRVPVINPGPAYKSKESKSGNFGFSEPSPPAYYSQPPPPPSYNAVLRQNQVQAEAQARARQYSDEGFGFDLQEGFGHEGGSRSRRNYKHKKTHQKKRPTTKKRRPTTKKRHHRK